MPTKPRKAAVVVVAADSVRLSVGRLATLVAVREVLARQLDAESLCAECRAEFGEPPAAKAALAKELRAVLAEIDVLAPAVKVVSAVDQIAERRAEREARVADAHVHGTAARRVRQRPRG